MDVGELWAYRERINDLGCPVTKAEVLKPGPRASNKTRVRLHEGEYAGLDLWVPTIRLRVPWDEKDAWLRDEHAFAAACEDWDGDEASVEFEATRLIVWAYPRPDGIILNWPWRGVLRIAEPEAVARDLGTDVISLLREPRSFLCRHGYYHAPYGSIERLVPFMVRNFRDAVLTKLVAEEAELQHEAVYGRTYGEGWSEIRVPAEEGAKRLRERQPVFDLVRDLCGAEGVQRFDELAALRVEVERLRVLVLDAASRFKEFGHPLIASKLRAAATGTTAEKGKNTVANDDLRN